MSPHDLARNWTADLDLTGFSYDDWERKAVAIATAVDRAMATGFADSDHLNDIDKTEAAIAEEIEMLNDAAAMSDAATSGKMLSIRDRLISIYSTIHDAGIQLRKLGSTDSFRGS